ncbi:hypothetical protein [Rhodoligotrophos ferricapiens]|uniref:hypothetical protein n=1 Tax=Rhodoligotrophos ferricapiens TaxID=3069264 RepID=UPI00315E020E
MRKKFLQNCKNLLQERYVSDVVYCSDKELIGRAAEWARSLIQREVRGPGDLPRAMKRLERRYDLPERTLWNLRYRPNKLIASVYLRLQAAYEAETKRQIEMLKHELELTKAATGEDATTSSAIRAAEALVASVAPPEISE